MEENLVHNDLEFLKVLEKYTLDSKLLACQKYSSRIMTCSMVDMKKAINENIMPWEIEAFAAYSIVYDNKEAKEDLDSKTFADTITLIRNYWHSGLTAAEESGEYPEVFMMISALQQFPVQGLFLQKLFRYHYFFTFQNNELDMKKVFYEKMGVNYERLEEFAFLVFLGFSKEAQDTIPESALQQMLMKVLSDTEVLRLLSIEKETYKEQLSVLYKDDIIDQYYGLKIQYLYPFISGKSFTYVPSPYLVVNAVTESMLNRITFHDNKLRRAIGKEVIEKYLYDIVEQLDTVTWITPELSYSIGKDKCLTSDVIASEEDKVIFYDTKAITPSLKLRKFDKTEIENDIKIYAEDVIQIYKQIRNYLNGFYKLNKDYSPEDIFGIVVVLEDAVVSRKKVYEKAYEILQKEETLSEEDKCYICSHIKVMPLRAIESMILQNTSLLPELQAQLNIPERWYDYTYTNETIENGLIPLYEQYEQDIKCRICNLI
ncbi:hypothetical protein P261_01371 [Lachnospiraceae bacterium TWA4]|nr:hypothetical protein P261_01371 [Lachnospiraceae bacterium TWA4]